MRHFLQPGVLNVQDDEAHVMSQTEEQDEEGDGEEEEEEGINSEDDDDSSEEVEEAFSDFNVKEKVDWYIMDTFTNFTCSCPDQCLQKFPQQDLSREIHRHFMLKEYQRRVMCQCMLACCVSRLAGDKTGTDQVRRAKRAKLPAAIRHGRPRANSYTIFSP